MENHCVSFRSVLDPGGRRAGSGRVLSWIVRFSSARRPSGVRLAHAAVGSWRLTLMSPASNNGKICYLEIPATDINRSSTFYQKVFGWKLRTRGDGKVAFDDATGGVSGTWVIKRPPSS